MKLLAYFLAVVACVLGAPNPDTRIVGGWDAERGHFNSIVSLRFCILSFCSHSCGGTIISPSWILTAAHCSTEAPSLGSFSAVAGVLNLDDDNPEREVVSVSQHVLHPRFEGGVGPHDIALFRLASPLVYNRYIQPIRLPRPGVEPSGIVNLTGWGSTGGILIPQMPNRLQTVILPIVPVQECDDAIVDVLPPGTHNPLDHEYNICTGPLTESISACSGDSGGPLIQDDELVGVVSWGISPCGTLGAPSVYVRTNQYFEWIKANVDEDLL